MNIKHNHDGKTINVIGENGETIFSTTGPTGYWEMQNHSADNESKNNMLLIFSNLEDSGLEIAPSVSQ